MSSNLGLLSKAFASKESTEFTPSDIQDVYYLFFKKGIDFNTFVTLPIPYIIEIIGTNYYYKKLENDAQK